MDNPYHLHFYETIEGKHPFYSWLLDLKERKTRTRILAYLDRLSLGNLGNVNSVGEGVQEVKIDFGPGFRVYFAFEGNQIILLLTGGDKSTQSKDIETAKQYWQDYQSRKEEHNG